MVHVGIYADLFIVVCGFYISCITTDLFITVHCDSDNSVLKECSPRVQIEVGVRILHYCFGEKKYQYPDVQVQLYFPWRSEQELKWQQRGGKSVENRWAWARLWMKLKNNQIQLLRDCIFLCNIWQNTFTACVEWMGPLLCVCAQMWHDVSAYSIVSGSPFSPPSFLCFKVSSSLPSLLLPVLYFSPFLSSCCFIWLPDLSSVISVHPLHFDVSPHTATLTTTKTRLVLALYLFFSLFVSLIKCVLSCSIQLFCCISFFFTF